MSRAICATLCLLVSISAGAAAQCVVPKQQEVNPKKTPIPLCLVAQKVQETLALYNNNPYRAANALPSLKSVDFDFKTTVTNTEGLKFCIFIFTVGGTYATSSTDDVTFSYQVPQVPPPHSSSTNSPETPTVPPVSPSQDNSYQALIWQPQENLTTMTPTAYVDALVQARHAKPVQDFSAELIETLFEAAEQIKATQSVGPATFKTLTITLSYGATWDFNASVALPISLVTASPSLDHNHADTQTLKLTFENPGSVETP